MMAQAIYATFCHAFPTSYRQFNGDFRDEILSLCLLWTMGKNLFIFSIFIILKRYWNDIIDFKLTCVRNYERLDLKCPLLIDHNYYNIIIKQIVCGFSKTLAKGCALDKKYFCYNLHPFSWSFHWGRNSDVKETDHF